MPTSGRPFSIDIGYRTVRRLLCCYLLFIVYASINPFHFSLDPNFIRWRLDIFFSRSLFRGVQRWSGSDEAAKLTVANQTFHADNLVFALIGAAVGAAMEFRVPYRSLYSRRTCSFQLF